MYVYRQISINDLIKVNITERKKKYKIKADFVNNADYLSS